MDTQENATNSGVGPNTITGHTSTVFAVENAINYSLRILKPVLDGEAVSIECSQEAEDRWDREIQDGMKKTVWSGNNCNNWYSRDAEGKQARNASTYPFTQGHFWYKSFFPIYDDLAYSVSFNPHIRRHSNILLTISAPSGPPRQEARSLHQDGGAGICTLHVGEDGAPHQGRGPQEHSARLRHPGVCQVSHATHAISKGL